MAQWTARWTSNPAVAGSSPVKSEFYNTNIKSNALVAQWIARWTSNPTVAGSSPVKSEFWVFYVLASMNVHLDVKGLQMSQMIVSKIRMPHCHNPRAVIAIKTSQAGLLWRNG